MLVNCNEVISDEYIAECAELRAAMESRESLATHIDFLNRSIENTTNTRQLRALVDELYICNSALRIKSKG